uniref:EamA domain-containing protein n=1 Tax=Lotharella globosa TaxID=91324 RepID=A0A7S3ZBW3_9EUKA
MLLSAAVSWSLYICRYGRILAQIDETNGSQLTPLSLTTWKSILLAALYLIWGVADVAGDFMHQHADNENVSLSGVLSHAWGGYGDWHQWLAIFYSAVGVALAHLIQGIGQKRVASAESNVLLSSEPIWTYLFAFVLLHESLHGVQGYVGGALIIAATLLSSGALEIPTPASAKKVYASDEE